MINKYFIFILGIFYPLFVYFFIDYLHPFFFVSISLLLVFVRLLNAKKYVIWSMNYHIGLFIFIVMIMSTIIIKNPLLAVKIYPVIISVIFASIFGFSLLYPPSIIERIARITTPQLPSSGIIYTYKVTFIWTIFFIFNGCISLASALWGTAQQWILWNSFLSYICMGGLFIGEYCIRKIILKKTMQI